MSSSSPIDLEWSGRQLETNGMVWALAFMANDKYLVSGDDNTVRVWRMQDGKEIATMEAEMINCLAVSKDGRWIAAGTLLGWAFVWDATTHEKVFQHKESDIYSDENIVIHAIDFSPDSTRFLVGLSNGTTAVWRIASHQKMLQLEHARYVIAAKYSPQGGRIATATSDHIRVWDSTDGRSLVNIEVQVTPCYNNGLLWFDNHLFVLSENNIKRFELSEELLVSEFPVPKANGYSCIALPQHGEFIAYSANHTITFWNTSTYAQLAQINHSDDIRSIAFSPDDQSLAVGNRKDGKIIIKYLPHISSPDIQIDRTILDLWNLNRLVDVELSLKDAFVDADYHTLYSLALVKTRLKFYDTALVVAEQSIEIRPSVFGYIAKSTALAFKGEKLKAYRACDIAFSHCDSAHVHFLLLVKAIIIFITGEHDDALSRVDDLITTVTVLSRPVCSVIQAYMHFLIGNSHMESGNYGEAIQSFERARDKVEGHAGNPLVISLIFGWNFDHLDITIRQRLCEALLADGRTKEGGDSLFQLLQAPRDEEVYTNKSLTEWVSHFAQRCLSAPHSSRDTTSEQVQPHQPVLVDVAIHSAAPSMLLREWAKATLLFCPWRDTLISTAYFSIPRFRIYQVLCERLETMDCIIDATECLQEMMGEFGAGADTKQNRWTQDFKQRCSTKLVRSADKAAASRRPNDAITLYSIALLLHPTAPQEVLVKRSQAYVTKNLWELALRDTNEAMLLDPFPSWSSDNVLTEWAKVSLTNKSWRNALAAAGMFDVSRFAVFFALCEHLEMTDRMVEAVECFHEMENSIPKEEMDGAVVWISDFQYRCCDKLVELGDAAMGAEKYDHAISQYSAALTFDSISPNELLVKRSEAYASKQAWEDALNDANEVVRLDQSSPLGHKRRYVALRGGGSQKDMLDAFETMLLKMSQSPDSEVLSHWKLYTGTKEAISRAVQVAIQDSPRVLLNTASGRLCDKLEQVAAFETSSCFTELVLSMTTDIDLSRIEEEVTRYYRYATFSHKWEPGEPLFEKVMRIVVHELDGSLTHDKLRMFCKVVREAGFSWAWSDTCCINKADPMVLQEAIIAMFKWYQGSSLTVVFLRGVQSRGGLVGSVWNSRAWTYQEYHASKVVRFYTEDWKPYLDADIPNHKDSPEIMKEMEEATKVSSRVLIGLRPGLDDIRTKLCLASHRQTTLIEDEAYSLLGMFSVSMSVVYGEGDKSLGRLLAQLLISSGDTSILAWTGVSGGFNSCLPTRISVFKESATAHIPLAINDAMTTIPRSSLSSTSVMKLYDQLCNLPVPLFAGKRMKLPCLAFKLGRISRFRDPSEQGFRAQTDTLGVVEIRTSENLSRLGSLYIVHPWIDFLLDRQPVGSVSAMETVLEESEDAGATPSSLTSALELPLNVTPVPQQSRGPRLPFRFALPFSGQPTTRFSDVFSLRPPSSVSHADKQLQAFRVMARLRQPFGALLLATASEGVAAFKRVATESLIRVQIVEQITPTVMKKLIEGVRVVDVL